MDGMTTSGMPTNLTHSFSQVPSVEKPRSTFERSSAHKLTFDPDVIFPFYYDQIYPADTMQLVGNLFARLLSPLKRPIMDNMYLDWWAFFVPERLLWTHFQQSMGEQANPGDSTNYLIPQVNPPTGGSWGLHSLGDYFHTIGAVLGGGSVPVNAMKFRAYNKIILDWFHDQNLQNSPPQNVGDGPDSGDDYTLFNRRKRLDYFTSQLPFAQKGTAVQIPIGGTVSVLTPTPRITTYEDAAGGNAANLTRRPFTGGGSADDEWLGGGGAGAAAPVSGAANSSPAGLPLPGDMYVDLATAIGPTVNAMRLFITTQQFLEINARSGTRYIEQNLAHFGVVSPDARLQRSEFLAGGTISITSHPIAQTSETATTPQGTLTAFGTLSGNVHATHSFVEHGYVIFLAESRADQTYWQGIAHDMWERSQLDRYYPTFANIGEQGVMSREIYSDGAPQDTDIFGYLPPFEHLRYKPSTLGGYFRPDAPGSLDFYHLAQDYGVTRPTLNATFIGDKMPIGRVVAVNASPYFILDSWFVNRTTRVLPVFSIPGLVRL